MRSVKGTSGRRSSMLDSHQNGLQYLRFDTGIDALTLKRSEGSFTNLSSISDMSKKRDYERDVESTSVDNILPKETIEYLELVALFYTTHYLRTWENIKLNCQEITDLFASTKEEEEMVIGNLLFASKNVLGCL